MDLSIDHPDLLLHQKRSFRRTFLRWWRQEFIEISRKQLSRGSDKLAALTGIVSSMQTSTGDVDRAGMWKSDLHCSIGWRCSDYTYTRNSIPDSYRAPSWCWFSLAEPGIIYNTNGAKRRKRAHFSFKDMRLMGFDLGPESDSTSSSTADSDTDSRLEFLVLGKSPSVSGAYVRIGFCEAVVLRVLGKKFVRKVKHLERQTLGII